MKKSCWRCGVEQQEAGYCAGCSLDISRERIWSEAGFPGNFDPEFDIRFDEKIPMNVTEPKESEFHIIELEPGSYYLAESASVSGYLFTAEPLRASRVNPVWCLKDSLPRLKKAHPEARLVIVKALYTLAEGPTA